MPLQSGSHFAIHTPLSLNSILGHLSFGLLLQSLKWSPASCFPSSINTTYCCQNYLPKIQISSCHCPHQILKRFPDPTENSFFLTWKDLSPLSRSASSEISSQHALIPVATCHLWTHWALGFSTILFFHISQPGIYCIAKHLDLPKPSLSFRTQYKSHLWNEPQNAQNSSTLFLCIHFIFYVFTLFSHSAFYVCLPIQKPDERSNFAVFTLIFHNPEKYLCTKQLFKKQFP